MRVLCCGSRDFDNLAMIVDVMYDLPEGTIIIEGGAPGADTLCKQVGIKLGFTIETYPADWEKYGKPAGMIRNKQMVNEGKPDLVLAFRSKSNSRGTNNTIQLVVERGIPCEIFDDFESKGSRKTLECSSRGDKRFSALYAKIEVLGKIDTIENHYQRAKKKYAEGGHFVVGCRKGEMPDFIILGRKKFEVEQLTPYYKLLWLIYLDKNPDLVEYASQFDDYHDMFKGKSINCQADAIRQYIKQGRGSILEEGKELLDVLWI